MRLTKVSIAIAAFFFMSLATAPRLTAQTFEVNQPPAKKGQAAKGKPKAKAKAPAQG